MSNIEETELIPELGDLLTIVSDVHKSTTGRIIYRDASLIRVRPAHVSDRAIDFPLDDAGLFQESLGVHEIILHEKAKYFHYSRQLGVLPGESLEFYNTDGQPSSEPGVVATILADDTQDAIQLEDGRILNFAFLGAPAPYEVIVPRSAPEEYDVLNNTEETEEVYEELPEIELPAPLVEEIPTSERTYSDAVQREDMYVSLLLDVPLAKQKNPRILRNIYRKTDLLLALKNSMVVRDDTGSVLPDTAQTYTPNTLSDLLPLQVHGSPVAALLPVADVKKVVYVDDITEGVYEDVDVRSDVAAIAEAATSTIAFRGAEQVGNPFLSYMDFLLSRNLPAVVPRGSQPTHWIQQDQDVLRTAVPPHSVQGFPAELPPAIVQKGEAVPLTTEFLGTVSDRTVRLLSATNIVNRRTGLSYQIAPADSGEVVDHILLTEDLLNTRTPTRSSVLLWDIQASEISRHRSNTFYAHLMRHWADQHVVGTLTDAEKDLAAILGERVSTALQIAERPVFSVLDSFGMRNLEINQTLMDVLAKALLAGRTAWDTAMEDLRKRAIAALSTDAIPILSPISEGHSLWTDTVLSQEDISAVLETLKDREPSLYQTHAARTSHMLTLANGTLLNVWYGIAGAAAEDAISTAIQTYRAERRRLDRAIANVRTAEAAFAAAPHVNECQHVYLLESIQSIRDDAKRYAVLKDFLTKYQSGIRGNWVICGSCEKNLICRHELMLLHEFLHPGRSVSLHKTLLLEFSGPVFEGAYICKNCGQKIADLEFDTHLEFDDEGRPLVGRTIVENTEEEEGQERIVLAEEGKERDGMSYEGEDLKVYYILRTVLEHCGITPTPELYKRMIGAVRDFMREKIPSMEVYAAMKQRGLADKPPRRLPDYTIYSANIQLGVIGALTVLEIQTGDFAIPFPAHGCKLERSGFPLEPQGLGTIAYVSCVIAGILRNDAPWTVVSWHRETSLPKRQAAIGSDIQQSLKLLLAIPGPTGKAPAPLTTVTEIYTSMLDTKRTQLADTGIAEDMDLHISADRIPIAFRPLPIVRHIEEESAVPNKTKLQQDVAEGAIPDVKAYVAKRQQDILQETVHAFYKASMASAKELHILSESNPRSEAACCFRRLGAVAIQGNGVASLSDTLGDAKMAEMELLEESAAALHRRDPAASSNGTHIYVPWSAPITRSELPQADPSMYYKLFVKNCFRGENVGFPHEYGMDWVCRHCKYACPSELEYLTGAELGGLDGKKFQKAMEEMDAKRQELAISSLEGQVNEESFHALEDAIHIRKSVVPYIFPSAIPMTQSLESMLHELRSAGFSEQTWTLLQETMARIEREGIPDSAKRRQVFSAFATARDQVLERLGTRMNELLGMRPSEAMRKSITSTLDALVVITERVEGAQGARNILTFLLTPLEQVASGYKNEKPRVNKWFPKVARSHQELLHRIWEVQNTVVNNGERALSEVPEKTRVVLKDMIRRLTTWMGPWIQHWIRDFRAGIHFTASEIAYILQWSIANALTTMLEDSMYVGIAPDVKRAAHLFFKGFFIDALQEAQKYVEKTQLTAVQIQDELLARQEMERAAFIRKFDVLDRDMRQVELIKKRLKIGDWAVGNMKNLFQYDADFFEFERGQRADMGLPEFAGDIVGGQEGRENPYGFMDFGTERVEVGVNDHRVAYDEDT